MNLKLYVGNLPFGASEEDLRKLFAEAGTVQSIKIDRERGQAPEKKGWRVQRQRGQEQITPTYKKETPLEMEGA
jgi:RNA recognition motif-containing protein